MKLVTFKNKLVEIMNTLADPNDANLPFNEVFGFLNPQIRNSPTVLIYQGDGASSTRLTSRGDVATMEYMIRAVWTLKMTQEIEDAILNAIDKTFAKFHEFQKLDTLDGLVDKFEFVSIDRFCSDEDAQYCGFTIHVRGSYYTTST